MTQARRHVHSPRVRRAAQRHGVALDGLRGSGPNGRVTVTDVEHAATDRPSTADPHPVAVPAGGPSRPFALVTAEVDTSGLDLVADPLVARFTTVLAEAVALSGAAPRRAVPPQGASAAALAARIVVVATDSGALVPAVTLSNAIGVLSVGLPAPRVVVRRDATGTGIAVGEAATVALTYDCALLPGGVLLKALVGLVTSTE